MDGNHSGSEPCAVVRPCCHRERWLGDFPERRTDGREDPSRDDGLHRTSERARVGADGRFEGRACRPVQRLRSLGKKPEQQPDTGGGFAA
ncbi:MAG: hypothetical protein WCK90_00510 [archaeon]